MASMWEQLLDGWKSFANLASEDVAKVVGLWTAARAAVGTVASGIAEVATYETVRNTQAKYLDKELTPAVLADMVVRNIIASDAGTSTTPILSNIDGHDVYAEAAFSGIDHERLNALILDTGESYGILDALRLYNRGQYLHAANPNPDTDAGQPLYVEGGSQAALYGITEPELETVIHYSRVRDQFIADLKLLSKNTLTPADAVEIAVKQIMSTDDAQDLFAAGGGIPEQFHLLVDAAGDSAGVEKAVELAAHGVITQAQLQRIVGMSRMNPRFYYLTEPDAAGNIPLNTKWLPPFEIKEAVAANPALAPQAMQWMTEAGYPADQAKAFAASLTPATVAKAKTETEAMVLEEYQAGLLTQAEASTGLTNLGYSAASIPFLLQYAQAKQVISARNTAVSRIRTGFLLQLTTADQARSELAQVGVQATAVNTLIADWTAELAVPHTALSIAEIGWFVEHGTITLAEGESLWKMRGLTAADVALMAQRYPPPAPKATTGTTSDTGL